MTTLLKFRPRQAEGSSYAFLRDRVRKTLLEGQQKIEQQKVLTYWEAGKLIKQHIFLNKGRADYGKKTLEKLSEDLDLAESVLWKILQFAEAYSILSARRELTWAHYRVLMTIPDSGERSKIEKLAAGEQWTSRELEIEVRNRHWLERFSKDGKTKAPRLAFVCLGPFYTYQIIRPETIHSQAKVLLLDLGFSHSLEMDLFKEKFPAETLVTAVKGTRGYSLKKFPLSDPSHEEDFLYTYKAFVEKVLDGDTLKVEFQLGFGNRQRETIRLNAIDCPEMDSPEGKAAKRFVESQLASCEFITVKSVKTRKEKWGRYLGDVFFAPSLRGDRKSTKQSQNLVYLNQLLLDKGHAVRVRM